MSLSFATKKHNLYHHVLYEIAWLSANLQKIEEFDKYKKEIKSLGKKIPYYKLICTLASKYPTGEDVLKAATNGLKLAYKSNDYINARLFEQTICNQYIGMGELEKAEFHANNSESISNQMHDLDGETIAIKTKAVIATNRGFLGKAINYQNKALKLRTFQQIDRDVPDIIQALGTMYGMVGHLEQFRMFTSKINDLTKGEINSVNLIPKYTLASFYLQLGEVDIAKKHYLSLLQFCKENQISLLVSYIQLDMFQIMYSENPNEAEEGFTQSVDLLITNNQPDQLNPSYYNKGWVYAENRELNKIKKCLDEWQSNVQNIPDLNLQIVITLKELLDGNINSALTRIHQLETKFDGSHLLEFIRVYKFLSQLKNISKSSKDRFKRLYNVLTGISENSCKGDIKVLSNRNNFESFLLEWYCSIKDYRTFSLDILDRFAIDEPHRSKLLDLLKLWGIYCSYEEDILFPDSQIPDVKISLLGTPKLYVNGKELSSKDWKSKRTIEVLIYLIVKGWSHKSQVKLDDLLNDLWMPEPEKFLSAKKSRKVIISRLRSLFKITGENLIPVIGDSISFKWESENYSLDIDRFLSSSRAGIIYFQNEDNESAVLDLELALSEYNGILANGYDFVWLESLRGEFYRQFINSMKYLKICYEKLNDNEKLQLLASRSLKIYPDDPTLMDIFSS